VEFITRALSAKLSGMFMISESDIDVRLPLAEYGIDSLVTVELRGWICQSARADISVDISVFDLTKSRSMSALEVIMDQS
jgi:hypothetical protein